MTHIFSHAVVAKSEQMYRAQLVHNDCAHNLQRRTVMYVFDALTTSHFGSRCQEFDYLLTFYCILDFTPVVFHFAAQLSDSFESGN